MDAWVEPVYFANCFDGFNGIATGLFLAGGDWEGEAVDDDVFNPEVPIANQSVNKP